MSVVLQFGNPEYYQVDEKYYILATGAMFERAYGEACYQDGLKLANQYGLHLAPHTVELYRHLIERYKDARGPRNTVGFTKEMVAA